MKFPAHYSISVPLAVVAHQGLKIFCLMGFAALAGDWAGVCVSIYLIGLIVPGLCQLSMHFFGDVVFDSIVPKREHGPPG